MTDRNELYRKFGPKLAEAITEAVLDQLNVLGALVKPAQAEITKQQVMDTIFDKLEALSDYDWMAE